MNDSTEFEDADEEMSVAVLSPPADISKETSIVPAGVADTLPTMGGMPANVVEYREQLVTKYHEGSPSLIKKLRQAGKEDAESLVVALLDEVIKETDHLLGNELVATQNGDLRDASIISFKRAEVLEKAIKSVQERQDKERTGGVDVDSPSMMIVIRFFMAKARDAFDMMGVGDEVRDLFFRTFSEVMDNWKKDLRDKFEESQVQG